MTTASQEKTVFVAGGSGTIGVPLVRALVEAGYHVVASTRSPGKQASLRNLGAIPVLVDALDAIALERAVVSAMPACVIHQLTALPKGGPRSARALEPTNRLRVEGTRNLLRGAIAAGAGRIIVGSFAPAASAPDAPFIGREMAPAAEAVRSMESQVLDAARRGAIEAIVLRYGLFYGPGNPSTEEMLAMVRKRRLPRLRGDQGQLPYIHVDDAAAATVAAVGRGISGGVYDIVDDRPASFSEMVTAMAEMAHAPRPFTVPGWLPKLVAPYMARVLSMRLPLSNAEARRDLAWAPRFPTYREGLRQTIEAAA